MKWIAGLLVITALGTCTNAALRIEPREVDLGVVKPNTPQKQSVTITNDGSAPVKLLEAQVECEMCTRVTFAPTELAPGKKIEIPITFDPPATEKGAVQRKVTFTSNEAQQPQLTVNISAYVTDIAGLVPHQLSFVGQHPAGEKITRDVTLVNVSQKAIKVLYGISPVDGPRITVPKDPIAPGQKAKLSVVWSLPVKPGEHRGEAVIFLDHPTLSKLTLPYLINIAAAGEAPAPGAKIPATTQASTSAPATGSSSATPAVAEPKLVRLELKDGLSLNDLVDIIATQLKLNLVYDQQALNVPVSVRLAGPLPEDALLPLLRSVLQAKGFALVSTERPEIWRIVASKEATQIVGTTAPAAGGPNQIISDVITPTHVDVETLAGVLKGFVTSGTGQVTAVPGAKLLIVTDYKTQVDRLRDLVNIIDKAGPKTEASVEVVPVKAAEVGPLVERINRLLTQLDTVEGVKADQSKLFISADPQNNQIVLVGQVSEFSRVRQMIQQFDVPPVMVRTTYTLTDDQITTAPALVAQVLGPAAHEPAADGSPRVTLLGNAMSVVATEGQHQRLRDLLKQQQAPQEESESVVLKVYHVQNRDAAEIEATLVRLIGGGGAENFGGEATNAQLSSLSPLTGEGINRVGSLMPPAPTIGQPESMQTAPTGPTTRASSSSVAPTPSNIALDVGTNSLLIAATPEMHKHIAQIIEQLDQRQAQVLLEVMLVSVSDSNTFSYAVEAALRTTKGGSEQLIGSNFGIGSGPLSDRALNVGPGINAAVFNPEAFAVLVQALEQTNKAKVMSLPQILALDNKQATIRSVQQEPFTSINASQTVSTTSFGGFAEAGTTLEITPHIAPADYLNLEYRLEVSSFTGASPAASVPPPRRSDTISSFISVPDGHTVIVGGLQSNSRSEGVSKIPGLGDIPILGLLGRSQNNVKSNSTFYIFVRPTILRSSRFEDLKYLSQQPRSVAGIAADYPQSQPHYIPQ